MPAKPPSGPVLGPPIRLLPAAEARQLQLASISIPSLDRLLGAGTALIGRAVPLPLDPVGVRDMLLSQAGLSPAVGENLDFASPSGAAIVSLGPNVSAGLVMAVPAKGVAQAKRVIEGLGTVVTKRGSALQVDNGTGGKGWVWQSNNVLVISDSVEALAIGAMLALEARRTGPEDVTAVLFPEAIARANGTDVKTALARVLDQARAAQAAQAEIVGKPGAKPGAKPAVKVAADDSLEMLADLLGYIGDAATVEIGLVVDTNRGLSVRARFNAKPGSGLEKLAREVHPFQLDPALFAGGGDVAFVFASSYGPFFRDQMAKQRRRLQANTDKAAPAALKFHDALFEAVAGQAQAAGRVRPHLSMQLVYPLKDAASGKKLAAALARLDRSAALALWNAQMGGSAAMFDWTIKKESVGKLKTLHYTLSPNSKAMTPAARDAIKKLFGGSVDTYVAVAGDRMVATVGKDAKSQLLLLASGKKGQPSGEVAQAIDASRGKDSFGYVDLGPLLGFIAGMSEDPRAAMFAATAKASVPIYGTLANDGAGKVMTLELTLPPAAFVGVGAVMQGLGAGPPPKQ